MVVKAYESQRPNLIADYLFNTAKLFNSFYNSVSILKTEDEELMNGRILLSQKTAKIIVLKD